jgi:hypothetical protein
MDDALSIFFSSRSINFNHILYICVCVSSYLVPLSREVVAWICVFCYVNDIFGRIKILCNVLLCLMIIMFNLFL